MIEVVVIVRPPISELDTRTREGIYEGLINVAKRIKREVSHPPGPVVYPLAWKSERQRRAVMTKLYRTRIPYERRYHPLSEDLYHSWKIWGNFSDLEARVYTDVSYAPYVKTRTGIQPFHRRTGHTPVEEDIKRVDAGRIVDVSVQRKVNV